MGKEFSIKYPFCIPIMQKIKDFESYISEESKKEFPNSVKINEAEIEMNLLTRELLDYR